MKERKGLWTQTFLSSTSTSICLSGPICKGGCCTCLLGRSHDPSPSPGRTYTSRCLPQRPAPGFARTGASMQRVIYTRTHSRAERTQAHICRHVSVHPDAPTHRHMLMPGTTAFTQADTHTGRRTHTCTHGPRRHIPHSLSPPPCTLALAQARTPAHTHAHTHPPPPPNLLCTNCWCGRGCEREGTKPTTQPGKEGCGLGGGGARAREMTARGPPRVPAHEY